MLVRYLTIPKPKYQYARTRSLSEALVERHLTRKGYILSRGYLLDSFFEPDCMLSIRNKRMTKRLLQQFGLQRLVRMAKYCSKRHGTPDIIAAHTSRGMVAIEVKLEHESIKQHQLETMKQLNDWGLECEVWRVAPRRNRVREKSILLEEWDETRDLRKSTRKRSYEERLLTRKAI